MDKLELLLDMIEHPERYTEQQLTNLLADEEMRKHYDVMVRLREAYDTEKVKSEREKSEKYILPEEADSVPKGNSHFSLFTFHFSLSRIAAIFIAATFLGGLAWAFVPRLLFHQTTEQPQPTKVSTPLPTREGQGGGSPSLLSFSNIPLDSIRTVVAAPYNCDVCFRDSAAMGMKFITTWNPEDSLAAFIEHLNMFDGLRLTLQGDTIFVETTNDEEGEQ